MRSKGFRKPLGSGNPGNHQTRGRAGVRVRHAFGRIEFARNKYTKRPCGRFRAADLRCSDELDRTRFPSAQPKLSSI